jgi:hypothetical protein
MSLPEIYADFQNLDHFNRLKLTCSGTRAELKRLGVELYEGLRLTFHMDDADAQGCPDELLVEGVVRFDDVERSWVADVDWSRVHHRSTIAR